MLNTEKETFTEEDHGYFKVMKSDQRKNGIFIIITDKQPSESEIAANGTGNTVRDIYHNRGMYNLDQMYPIIQVYRHVHKFLQKWPEKALDKYHGFTEFYAYVKENCNIHKLLKELEADGKITFDLLDFYLTEGQEVCWMNQQDIIEAGIVEGTNFQGGFMGPSSLVISVTVISHNGRNLSYASKEVKVFEWEGAIPIADVKVRKLTPEVKKDLVTRGKFYFQITESPTYMFCTGYQTRDMGWYGTVRYNSIGRIMIDRTNMSLFDSNYFSNSRTSWRDDDDDSGSKTIEKEHLWMAESTVYGFSFITKKWGEFSLDNLKDIEFDVKAFDTLVLDGETKTMIKSLVKQSSSSFQDIISGKGGGCIFLLHGKPGTGKTLTAEAVAEDLRRPLYSVTIGELGTNPDDLEDRLRKVLDMAQMWDAVLLLDEADIFMESRNETDIHRNAMVGIFLRLLEYHQGVMFLTTNRAKNLDPSMRSRIAIAINYNDHDEDTRSTIWRNLLISAGIDNINIADLVSFDVNGRQIKNAIRIGQSLAIEEKVNPTSAHFKRCIEMSLDFEREMTSQENP